MFKVFFTKLRERELHAGVDRERKRKRKEWHAPVVRGTVWERV